MSSGGRTPGVPTGAASRGSTPQTSIPVTTSAPTPSIPAAPATVVRGSIGRGSRGGPSGEGPSGEGPSGPTIPPMDISDMFEAGADTTTLTRGQMQDLIGRIIEVKFQQFAKPRSRRSRRSSSDADRDRRPQPVPLVELELDEYGIPEEDSLRVLGTMVREGPSNAEVGADDTAGEDDTSGADDGADGAAAGSDVGADDDGAERSELEGSGDEFEEDDQGQAPQQERVEELEDAEEDEDSSRFEIREALRVPVEPVLTEAQRIIRFITGGESSALRTLPQPAVLQAILLGPPSGVLRAIPRDPQPSVARTVTPQPSAARAVVSDPSRAQTTVPKPSSRQTRAQSQPASARGTEEQRGKKSKKSKK
ncbi:hypothetical protein R1sor_010169 [Riccia sorocarpa]|uniref:Uncharacterized protein n=1 Tax=Riccia sorocarpa TaxID=122646 RepID=A0ABD3HX73_9MARC